MTPKEKLEKMLGINCKKEYGLSITLSELMTFEEGREYAQAFFQSYVPVSKWPEEMFKEKK